MMRPFKSDLHLHSTLSPCGSLDMSPLKVINRAVELGLDIIAVTDHNMCENGAAFHEYGRQRGINVLFGMELNTSEEVHVICLFDDYQRAMQLQDIVYAELPRIRNIPELFGDQVVVNSDEKIIRFEERLLISATGISIDEAFEIVDRLGGLVIPSHVDRQSNSILSQIGFVPRGIRLHAVEISIYGEENRVVDDHPELEGVPFVRFSDAHHIDDIGSQYTTFVMESPTIAELKKALLGEDGRTVANTFRRQQ